MKCLWLSLCHLYSTHNQLSMTVNVYVSNDNAGGSFLSVHGCRIGGDGDDSLLLLLNSSIFIQGNANTRGIPYVPRWENRPGDTLGVSYQPAGAGVVGSAHLADSGVVVQGGGGIKGEGVAADSQSLKGACNGCRKSSGGEFRLR